MDQSLQAKLDRIDELRGTIAAAQAELGEILGGGVKVKKLRGGGVKKKYKRRVKKEPAEVEEEDEEKPAPKPTAPAKPSASAGGQPCCGSLGKRHKNGCPRTGPAKPAGKPPEGDEKKWKCLNCDHRQNAEEQPEECDECPGTVFVEVNAWE